MAANGLLISYPSQTSARSLITLGKPWSLEVTHSKQGEGTLLEVAHDREKVRIRLWEGKADGIPGIHFEMIPKVSGPIIDCFGQTVKVEDRPLRLTVPAAMLASTEPVRLRVSYTGPTLQLRVNDELVDEEWPVGDTVTTTPLWASVGVRVDGSDAFSGTMERLCLGHDQETSSPFSTQSAPQDSAFGQYGTIPGHNTGIGDCMPFWHEGRFHLFYLIDRRRHRSKWGLGAHQWAHASTSDLRKWEHHPLAVPITDEREGSICTGSALVHQGTFYLFYTIRSVDGSPAALHTSCSHDGIHFQKQGPLLKLSSRYNGTIARDPKIFWDSKTQKFHLLVTTALAQAKISHRAGCLAHLVSSDLQNWKEEGEAATPGYPAHEPECPDYFHWRGWYYLIFGHMGHTHYRMSREPFGPWQCPTPDVMDGPQLAVMKSAAFGKDRRVGVGFIGSHDGWGGHSVFREMIQQSDGSLSTAPVPEMRPAEVQPYRLTWRRLSDAFDQPAAGDLRLRADEGFATARAEGEAINFRLTLKIAASPNSGAFGLCLRASSDYATGHELRIEPGRQKVGWRPCSGSPVLEYENQALYSVKDLDRPLRLELTIQDDLLDICINSSRTLIARLPASLSSGGAGQSHLFLFAHNADVTFSDINYEVLKTASAGLSQALSASSALMK